MGSSSKNKGGGFQDPNAGRKPDAKMTKGPGFTGTNAYYSNKSMVPAAGGLVKPDALPGGIPGGIGLNFYKPPAQALQRDQLAMMMPRNPSSIVAGGSPGEYYGVPNMTRRRGGSGDRGGSHGGFSGSQGAGGYSGYGGGGPGNRGGGLY